MSQNHLTKSVLLAAAALALGACASDPSTCDPRAGGFIAGLSAMSSGCYDKRIEDRQDKLSSAQSLTDRLQRENKTLKQQKAGAATRKNQIRGRFAEPNDITSTAPHAKQVSNADDEKKVRALRAKIAATKKAQQGGSGNLNQLKSDLKKATRERDQMARDTAESLVH